MVRLESSRSFMDIKQRPYRPRALKLALFYIVLIAVIAGVLFLLILVNDLLVIKFPEFKFWIVPLFGAFIAVIVGNVFIRQSRQNDKLKYEFISIATHKLRTPLTRIKWEAATMQEQFKDNQQVQEAVKRIDEANTRLIDLTNVLVEASETDDMYYGYKTKYFDIVDAVKKGIERTGALAERKGVKVTSQIPQKIGLIRGDPNRIASVIDVLLENACMYSNAGGEVRITLEDLPRTARLSVSDDGIGISTGDQKHMFTRFYRSYAAKTADTEGMGLGLSMAKSIIDMHRGQIGVTSKGPGKGSTFWFSLKK